MLQNSFKNVVLSAAVVCLSSGVARESKADVASCASPIPLGLTTALTGNLALLGIQARNGVNSLSMKSMPVGESPARSSS